MSWTINTSRQKSITIFSNSKSIGKSFGLFSHHYLTIPFSELEIHLGKYYQGTHHTLGTFAKNSTKTGQYELCSSCFEKLMEEATYLPKKIKRFI